MIVMHKTLDVLRLSYLCYMKALSPFPQSWVGPASLCLSLSFRCSKLRAREDSTALGRQWRYEEILEL